MRALKISILPLALLALLALAGGASAQTTSLGSITRPNNTTTYTANTGWSASTSAASATFFRFRGVCNSAGDTILIPQIDIWSSANQSTKLQGILWLLNTTPSSPIADDATFTLTAADYANLTGGTRNGIAFTLANAQGGSPSNSGVSLTGTNYMATCLPGTTEIDGMVQVVNAYVPVANEVLTVNLWGVTMRTGN